MPKLKSEAVEEDTLNRYLNEDDDFRFEIEMFKLCHTFQLQAVHGGTYEDPVTKKDRQFDIRAKLIKRECVVELAVECKNLKLNFPLLVSRLPRLREESVHQIIKSIDPATTPSYPLLSAAQQGLGPESLSFCPSQTLFPMGGMVGKSTAQVGLTEKNEIHSGDSEAYEKWSQAIASCYDLVNRATHACLETRRSPTYTFIQPILLVPTNTLWVADYAADGSLKEGPRRVHSCDLYLDKRINKVVTAAHCTISHLLVLTDLGFQEYLLQLTNEAHWYNLFPGRFDQ